ncbi:MAG: hydroxymethylglutaryl-CoA lyase [Pseudomonadota bacterium]
MAEAVEIYEVGPRDGLQNEPREIATADKIALVDALSDAGFRRIECASFVNPKWVPQMAGSADVLAGIRRARGVRYAALTPNVHGYQDAMRAGADEVAVFGSASDSFSRANVNASADEALERFIPIVEAARSIDMPVRGYVSCVVECPFEGATDPGAVARVADRLFAMGCYEISLGETLGHASADSIARMLLSVRDVVPAGRLAGHYHDTDGHALGNIDVSLSLGVRVFDAAVGGLGGCPYAPGAAGNVATEAVAEHLQRLGYETGLDLDRVKRAADMARALRS